MKRRHSSLLAQQDWRLCFGAPRRPPLLSPLLPRTPFARSSCFSATCRCSSSTTSKSKSSKEEGNPLWLKVGSSFEPHPRFPRKEFHLVDAEKGLLGLFDGIGGMLTFDSNIRGYSPSDFPQALLGSVRSRLKDWDPNAIDAFQKAANERQETEEPIAKKNREEQERSRESALRAMEAEILQKKQAKDASEEDLKLSAAWQQCVQQFKDMEDKRKEQRLMAAQQSDSSSSSDMNLSKQVLLSAKRATQGQNVKGVSTAVLCMISSSAQMEDSSEATNEEEKRNKNKERGVNARIWEMMNRSGASLPSSIENEKKKEEAKEKEESQQGPSLQLWGAWLGNSVLSIIRNNRIYFKSEPK
ncbi:Protein phosphatase, variant 2 [Balamuthia mandrillaris]